MTRNALETTRAAAAAAALEAIKAEALRLAIENGLAAISSAAWDARKYAEIAAAAEAAAEAAEAVESGGGAMAAAMAHSAASRAAESALEARRLGRALWRRLAAIEKRHARAE